MRGSGDGGGDMGSIAELVERAQRADDPYIEGVSAQGEVLAAGFNLQFFEIHHSDFDHCGLCGTNMRKASFYDCTFTGCDFSNALLEGAYFARSRFVGCKLEGAQLTGAFLRSSRMVDCVCRYANMGELTLEGALLQGCDLREAFLNEVQFRKRTRLERCDLTRTDLFRTSLKGMDLSTCNIAGLLVSDTRQELRGAIIDAEQAVDLVGLLGVQIKS